MDGNSGNRGPQEQGQEERNDRNQTLGSESRTPGRETVEEYTISPPFSSVKILRDLENGSYYYDVNEPTLSENGRILLRASRGRFVSAIESYPLEKKERIEAMKDVVVSVIESLGRKLSKGELENVLYYLAKEFEGYGKVEVPLLDENVEDVSCVGPNNPIYVVHKKYGSISSSLSFESEEELDAFVRLLVQRSGKHISISVPMVDCSLPNGSRLQATLGKEVTRNGSTFTIRTFKRDPFTPLDLIKLGTMNVDLAVYLWLAIENGENMFVIGGTASGKTTTLNSILQFIPPNKKIVSIEDTKELNIPHENWVESITRQGTGDVSPSSGKRVGEVNMFDLLKSTLRQRPDYIVIGEVRGREAYTVFQSMATGQAALGTFHSNDIPSFVHRLEGEPLKIPRSMITALDVVVFQTVAAVAGTTVRRIDSIVEFEGIDSSTGEVLTNTVFKWDSVSDSFNRVNRSNLERKIMARNNWSIDLLERELEGREEYLKSLLPRNIEFSTFSNLVNRFNTSGKGDQRQELQKKGEK